MKAATGRILLTPAEAGELLGISGQTVRRLVAAGTLPGVVLPMPGGTTLLKVHRRHVDDYAAALAAEAERAMDVSSIHDWRRGAGTPGATQARGGGQKRRGG